MNASMRRTFYLVCGILAAAVPLLVQVGVLDTGSGESTNTLITSLASLLGAGGAVTAARVTHTQIKEGIHDPALAPIDAIAEAVPKVLEQQQQANQAVDRLRDLTTQLNAVPIVGQFTAPVSDVVDGLADQVLSGIFR